MRMNLAGSLIKIGRSLGQTGRSLSQIVDSLMQMMVSAAMTQRSLISFTHL
jgi:hypothetical protein